MGRFQGNSGGSRPDASDTLEVGANVNAGDVAKAKRPCSARCSGRASSSGLKAYPKTTSRSDRPKIRVAAHPCVERSRPRRRLHES